MERQLPGVVMLALALLLLPVGAPTAGGNGGAGARLRGVASYGFNAKDYGAVGDGVTP